MRAGLVLFFALGAFAQSEEPKAVVNLDGLQYPRLAEIAVIQGDIRFAVETSGRRLVSGNPLLARAAEADSQTWSCRLLRAGFMTSSIASCSRTNGLAKENRGR